MELFRLDHYGTYPDRLLRNAVPLDYFKSRVLLFGVSDFSKTRPVEIGDIPLEMAKAGDFIVMRAGAMRRNPDTNKWYLFENIEFF